MRRNLPHDSLAISKAARAGALGIVAMCLAVWGCSLSEPEADLSQGEVVVEIASVTAGLTLADGTLSTRRNEVDGIATDVEWGALPYTIVSMRGDLGSGGGNFPVAMKVARDASRIYMLLQWHDATFDARGPRLVAHPDSAVGGNCDPQLESCIWEYVPTDEDRLAVMFDMDGAAGRVGFDPPSEVAFGAPFKRHYAGQPLAGATDIWHWRAARSNPLRFEIAPRVRVGFAQDEYADRSGRRPDPGRPLYFSNIVNTTCGGPVPAFQALVLDPDGQPSSGVNGGVSPCDYIVSRSTGRTQTGSPFSVVVAPFDECETLNSCRVFNQEAVEFWVDGDDVAAYVLDPPLEEGQRGSIHDVEARGVWSAGTWTLELSRFLQTGNADDVQFDAAGATPYSLRLAVFDNSGAVFAGSPLVKLRF